MMATPAITIQRLPLLQIAQTKIIAYHTNLLTNYKTLLANELPNRVRPLAEL